MVRERKGQQWVAASVELLEKMVLSRNQHVLKRNRSER